jgi:hypothetical protein
LQLIHNALALHCESAARAPFPLHYKKILIFYLGTAQFVAIVSLRS